MSLSDFNDSAVPLRLPMLTTLFIPFMLFIFWSVPTAHIDGLVRTLCFNNPGHHQHQQSPVFLLARYLPSHLPPTAILLCLLFSTLFPPWDFADTLFLSPHWKLIIIYYYFYLWPLRIRTDKQISTPQCTFFFFPKSP